MRDRGRLAAVGGPELVEDVRRVDARRLPADEQRIGDLAVGPPGGDQSEDLDLAGRQVEGRGDSFTGLAGRPGRV